MEATESALELSGHVCDALLEPDLGAGFVHTCEARGENRCRVGVGVAALASIALAAGGTFGEGNSRLLAPPSPAVQAVAPPAFRPSNSAGMDPASALIPHANPLLGYTMKLPASYRLAVSVADTQNAGHDVYTHRDEAADRALCVGELQNQSESPERVADFKVGVYSNANAVSPVAFAASPNRRMAFTSIQSTTIDGHAAARVVHQSSGDTAYYVIAANGHLFEIAPLIFEQPTTQPRRWLDQIVTTFQATAAQPVPVASGPRSLCGPAN